MVVAVMDGVSGCLKSEKSTAMMRRYRRLRQIARVLRCAEVAAALFALTWSSSQLPAALHLLSSFFRRLSPVLISTPFVFLLGNGIVLTLFAKSRYISSVDPHLCHDFLRSSAQNASHNSHHQRDLAPQHDGGARPVVDAEKMVRSVETSVGREKPALAYRRTKSEQLLERVPADKLLDLRLSDMATALDRPLKKVDDHGEEKEEEEEGREVGVSNDELRRRVEAFIAKTLRFQREEESIGGGAELLE